MAADEQILRRAPSMTRLFARAGLAALPGASALPLAGGGGGSVPERALVLSAQRVDRDRLAAYDRVCGFDLSDVLPPTYPHMLAFPLQLALMTSGSFPVPAIGLVHIANRIDQRRPILASERLSLRVAATALEPHPRGRQFTLRSEAWVGAEKVWAEESVHLARGRGDEGAPTPDAPPDSSGLAQAAVWRLPGDLGRRYGAVSGDLNPIHVHPLTARLLGFPSAIAHGMWTKARCLAQLGRELPGGFTVQVAFRKPILLPARVVYAEGRPGPDAGGPADGPLAFGVRDARTGAVHLDGLLTPA
ncbi:MAG TPA: MaoC/PaaZ C-terminal domain-containing protein [Solirubrobacteraceae bacterium]|nr:MaoC/PaaZ C-terminal domain-containing protein [Solirubrobacteraceae bacterium]